MPRRRFQFGKPIFLVFIVLLAWWLVPAFVKSFLRTSFFEFEAPAWTALSHMRDLQEYWTYRAKSKDELIEAGRNLARLNASYEVRIQQDMDLAAQIARLEEMLNMPGHPAYRSVVARVVRRDINSWWNRMTIRKGRRHGISRGAAVIYSGGVVGRVVEVYSYTSVVELVSSSAFRVAAHFEGDYRPVTYRGGMNQTFSDPLGRVSNVPPDIGAGDKTQYRLVSSRLGGAFPDGLTIGLVRKLELSSDGLFQSGLVRLDRRLLSLREVAVLVPVKPEGEEER